MQTHDGKTVPGVGDEVGRKVLPARSTGFGFAILGLRRLTQLGSAVAGFKKVSGTISTVSPINDMLETMSSLGTPASPSTVPSVEQAEGAAQSLLPWVHFSPEVVHITFPQKHR